MGFSIGFVDRRNVVYDEDRPFLDGAFVLGSDEDRFLAPISYWHAIDYERHWRAAILRILTGAASSCIITSMYDPRSANFIIWWPMYRVDNVIFIQNQVLLLDKLPERFDENNPFQSVGSRQVISENGARISEWSVDYGEVRTFAERFGTSPDNR